MGDNKITITINEYTQRCLTEASGKKLFDMIFPILKSGGCVELDFKGIRMFASLYFNNGTGALFGHFNRDFIESHMTIVNLNETGKKAFDRSVENAVQFFALDKENQNVVDGIVSKCIVNN